MEDDWVQVVPAATADDDWVEVTPPAAKPMTVGEKAVGFGKEVVKGAAAIGPAIIEAPAIWNADIHLKWLNMADRIQAGDPMVDTSIDPDGDIRWSEQQRTTATASPGIAFSSNSGTGFIGPKSTPTLYAYMQAKDPAEKAALRQKFMDEIDPRGSYLYQVGKKGEATIEAALPTSPEFKASWVGMLGQGVGSTLGFGAGGLALKALRLPSLLGTAGLGSVVEGSQDFNTAVENGADLPQAIEAGMAGFGIGATEALPIEQFFGRLDKLSGGKVRTAVIDAVKSAGEEGAQEALQQTLSNIAQQYYKPDQDVGDGVGASAGVGGAVGALYGFLGGMIFGKHAKSITPAEQPATTAVPPSPPGEVEKAKAVPVTPPTPGDVASPIDTDLIQEGKAVIAEAQGHKKANEALGAEALPPVNSRVTVTYPDGRAASGTMGDSYTTKIPEIGASGTGVRIRMDDGTQFDELTDTIRQGGISITPEATAEENVSRETTKSQEIQADGQGQAADGGQDVQNAADDGWVDAVTGQPVVSALSPEAVAPKKITRDELVKALGYGAGGGIPDAEMMHIMSQATGIPGDKVSSRDWNALPAEKQHAALDAFLKPTEAPPAGGPSAAPVSPEPDARPDLAGPDAEGGPRNPIVVQTADDLARARERIRKPTPGQAEVMNYRHAHIDVQGIPITLETGMGQDREGVAPNGTPWKVTMPADYGRVKRSIGADEEEIDVYVGQNPQSQTVFAIDQHDAETGKFDEHKFMLGFGNRAEAIAAYDAAFSDGRGPERRAGVTPMSVEEFKGWLKGGKTKVPVDQRSSFTRSGKKPVSRKAASNEAAKPEAPASMAKPGAKTVRLYHGGANPGSGGGRWVSTSLEHARGYAQQNSGDASHAYYVDVPSDSAWLKKSDYYDEDGIIPTQEVPEEIAKQMKRVAGNPAAPATTKQDVPAQPVKPTVEIAPNSKVTPEVKPSEPGPKVNTKPAGYGAGNKLFTAEAAEKARAVLRSKLKQLNVGVDPETLVAGMQIAGFHLEAGARSFAAFTRAMVEDMGEGIRPYLRAFYNAVRDYPGFDAGGMTPVAEMKDEVSPTVAKTPRAAGESERQILADAFQQHLTQSSNRFASITEARVFAAELLGRKVEPGTADAKMVDEAVELGVVQAARVIVTAGEKRTDVGPKQIYTRLVSLYERQPKLGVRTSTSVREQAYSTPVPLGYIADRLAGITRETTVYEPTAGNGALLLTADPAKVTANELNPDRAAALRATFPNVTVEDAAASAPAGKFDRIVANPPFGPVKGASGATKRFQVNEVYQTAEIDHAIAFKALESMKDDGRAVLIVASVNKQAKSPEARSDAYNSKAKREFYLSLYQAYNVTDHFTVAGDLYERQGAGWPVDVIVIQGRGKSALRVPAADVPRAYDSWDQLEEVLDAKYSGAAGSLREPGPVVAPAATEPGGAPGDAGDRGRGGEDRLGGQRERPQDGERGGIRDGSPAGQSERAGVAEPTEGGDSAADGNQNAARSPRRADVTDAAGEAVTQVPYQPASGAEGMGTLVPVNMQTTSAAALDDLRAQVGDIDAFVGKKLGYTKAEVAKSFGAEQVDALALGINAMDKGTGFIVGDQTGIGKGRVVAGFIRYAIKSGRFPIFVTEKPNLYADMYRDLSDIGIQKMLGREPKIIATNGGLTLPLDDAGKTVLRTKSGEKHEAELGRVGSAEDRAGYDVMFTTYSQMQTVQGKATHRMAVLKNVATGGIVIFDESHNAGGTSTSNSIIKKKGEDPDAPGGRAGFAREIARAAHGVVFSSATFAKRPDVMDLYGSTDMRLAVPDLSKLADAIGKGGVPMQQVVSSMLSRAGQYVRRERSFEGITYDTPVAPVDRATYAAYSRILKEIQLFSENFVKAATKGISQDLKAEAKSINPDGSTGGAGAQSTNFTSVMHNLINQMLLSIKADPAVDLAIEALARGEKPVLTVANTMGSFIQEYAEDMSLANGDPIAINFNSLLERYLTRTRWITIKKPFSKEKGERHYLTDGEIGTEGAKAFNAARKLIRDTDFSKLPVSPIDHMRARLIQAGYKIAEITGRTAAVDYHADGTAHYHLRSESERSIAARVKARRDFNGGEVDAMILNQAGSTGLSLHASETVKDQRKRRMILVQPEANIDTHMQMLGRVNRTGQVVLPGYDQLVADVPAEKRPAAVLAKKMASLNASTTASRKSALTSKDVPDFLNVYGDEVAVQVMQDNPDIFMALGEPLNSASDDEGGGYAKTDAMRKVTGLIPLLPVNQQEDLYELLESEYRNLLEQKEATGQSVLEAKTLDLDAKVKRVMPAVPAQSNSTSPFAAGVNVEEVSAKRISKPYASAKVLAMAAENSGLPKEATLAEIRAKNKQQHAADHKDPAWPAFKAYLDAALTEITDEAKKTQEKFRLDQTWTRWQAIHNTFAIGDQVRLQTEEGNLYGVVVDVRRAGKAKNPASLSAWRMQVAVVDAAREVTVPFSRLYSQINRPSEMSLTDIIVEHADKIAGQPILTAFDEMQTAAREDRFIVTGNLLAGFDHVGARGQIVNYTTDEGDVRQGILMPKGWDYAKEIEKLPVEVPTGAIVAVLEEKLPLTAKDGALDLIVKSGDLTINVAAAKAAGGRYYLDPKVIAAVGRDFVKVGDKMRASVSVTEAERVLDALKGAGAAFEVQGSVELKDRARKAIAAAAAAQPTVTVSGGKAAVQRVEPTEAFRQDATRLMAALSARMQQLGIRDKVGLHVAERLLAGGEEVSGYYSSAAGRRLMSISLTTADPKGWTLDHESVHALKEMGLFRPAEWAALETAARASAAHMASARKRYPNLSEEDQVEEAIADMFADWAAGRGVQPTGFLRSAFERVAAFLRALREVLIGHNYKTMDDIFRAVERGEIGARGEPVPGIDDSGPMGLSEKFMVAWHGGPHDFDAFSLAAMSTGEGNQAFGWGLYFAGEQKVAEYYRDTLSPQSNHDRRTEILRQAVKPRLGGLIGEEMPPVLVSVLAAKSFMLKSGEGEKAVQRAFNEEPDFRAFIAKHRKALIAAANDSIEASRGRLYTVDLAPSEEEYLDLDKPMGAQSQIVRDGATKALKVALADAEATNYQGRIDRIKAMQHANLSGMDFYIKLAGVAPNPQRDQGLAMFNGEEAASKLLLRFGVRGNRYLDEVSRFDAQKIENIQHLLSGKLSAEARTSLEAQLERLQQGRPTSNYVIFSDQDVKVIGKAAAPRIPRPAGANQTPPSFSNPAVEARFQGAKTGIGSGPSFREKLTGWYQTLANGFTRHFEHLPNTVQYADVTEQLRKLEAAPGVAVDQIRRILTDILGGFNAADMDLFTRKVMLDDLSWEVTQGRSIAFGLDPNDVVPELAKIDRILATRPDITEAVRRRKLVVRAISQQLVTEGVLAQEQVQNPAYYRHMVLDYARAQVQYAKDPASKLRAPYWAQRKGSQRDINANLLEAEFDWLYKALTDIASAKTIRWIDESPLNVRDAVTQRARQHNQAGVDAALAADLQANGFTKNGRQTSPLLEQWNGYRQRIAIGLGGLRKLIQDGTLRVPPRFQAAAQALTTQAAGNGEELFPLLAHILDNNLPGAMQAATVFKAISDRKLWIKGLLGRQWADTSDMVKLIKLGLAPEGYEAWQPEAPDAKGRGLRLYTTKAITEHALDKVLDRIALTMPAADVFALEAKARLRQELSDVLAVGGPRYQMIIPSELANTLQNLSDDYHHNIVEHLSAGILNAWKRWVLINPRRVLKYNLNNFSGDLDAVIAGNPGVLRRVPRAAAELYRVMKRGEAPSARYQEALDRAVFDSGLTIQEIPDINKLAVFRNLAKPESTLRPDKLTAKAAMAVWKALQGATQYRENVLRYAAYLDYAERIEAGEAQTSVGYGASLPARIDAITDTKDRAARLARDLMGDYGAISHYGRWIRRHIIPFWSWKEINTKRYWRLTMNAYHQGVGRGIATGTALAVTAGARRSFWLATRIAMMYGLLWLWNNLVFPDDEDELSPDAKVRLHINLGKDAEGNSRSLRFQGALSDYMNWFGFADVATAVSDIEAGRGDWTNILKAVAKAPVNQILQGITPVISLPVESVTGKDWWPDIFNTRPIRDRWRNIAETFSVDSEYDLLLGKPSRGYLESVSQSLIYKRDAGELAYNDIRGKTFDWLERTKGEAGDFVPTSPRAVALYNWRTALRYGDQEAARKYRLELKRLGATPESIAQSLQRAHPLGAIALKDRAAFLKTLTPEERKRLGVASRWYSEVFGGQ